MSIPVVHEFLRWLDALTSADEVDGLQGSDLERDMRIGAA